MFRIWRNILVFYFASYPIYLQLIILWNAPGERQKRKPVLPLSRSRLILRFLVEEREDCTRWSSENQMSKKGSRLSMYQDSSETCICRVATKGSLLVLLFTKICTYRLCVHTTKKYFLKKCNFFFKKSCLKKSL